MNPMVTANQKPTIRTKTHTKERNKSLLLKKVIKHQGRNRTKEKERKKKQRKTTKTTRKQVVKRKYYMPVSYYFKCQWTEFPDQEA